MHFPSSLYPNEETAPPGVQISSEDDLEKWWTFLLKHALTLILESSRRKLRSSGSWILPFAGFVGFLLYGSDFFYLSIFYERTFYFPLRQSLLLMSFYACWLLSGQAFDEEFFDCVVQMRPNICHGMIFFRINLKVRKYVSFIVSREITAKRLIQFARTECLEAPVAAIMPLPAVSVRCRPGCHASADNFCYGNFPRNSADASGCIPARCPRWAVPYSVPCK